MRLLLAVPLLLLLAAAPKPEEPVDPYQQSDANAGTAPMKDDGTFKAFHGLNGLERISADLVAFSHADPRTADIFRAADNTRLVRTLTEQFCYILGGGCSYSGRDMKSVHADMGLQTADFAALVENLQRAMDKERVPFAAQNRLLAKLAPMKRVIVVR